MKRFEPADPSWKTVILRTLIGALIWSIVGVPTPSGRAHYSANMVRCCEQVGDVDHNGVLRASDIITLVNYVFKGGAAPFCAEEADVNSDHVINASDLIYLVAYVFRGGPAPADCPYLIVITGLQPGDGTVHGSAYVQDTAQYRVVVWAKTDRWYVQPLTTEPYTVIHGDGSWLCPTNAWDRIVAVLVDTGYLPVSPREEHPSGEPGVIDWDEYPERSPDPYIIWSGYRWRVKVAELAGPGPNPFSADTANVHVDLVDRLHLRTDFRNDTWYCAEIVLDSSLGYGVYTFRLDSRMDSLNYNTIFAGFIYDPNGPEFDMEFSRLLADPFNAQYVVQPWYLTGRIEFYDMPDSNQTSCSFEWRADRIIFQSWLGHGDVPSPTTLIHTWIYTGDDIPIPGVERMRFNLYLASGDPPLDGHADEVRIASFQYSP